VKLTVVAMGMEYVHQIINLVYAKKDINLILERSNVYSTVNAKILINIV